MRILGLIAFRGWIAPSWLAVPARNLALTLLASLILFPAPLSAQSITFSKGAANTTKMQKALYYLGCYGGAYASVGAAADGDFGGTTSNSNQALKLLDDTADAELRGLIDSAENSSASIPALLDYLAGYLSEWKAGETDEDYCGEDNDLPTLSATALYDEVHSGRKAGALACSASTITSSYLEKFKDDTKLKSVRDLDAPLKTLIDKYSDVFDPTIAHDKEVHDDNVGRLEAVATIGKSRTETLELLKDARKALLALIARYGANDEPCGSCFAINDYKLLKSRAQAKFLGDTLYYSKNPTKVESRRPKDQACVDVRHSRQHADLSPHNGRLAGIGEWWGQKATRRCVETRRTRGRTPEGNGHHYPAAVATAENRHPDNQSTRSVLPRLPHNRPARSRSRAHHERRHAHEPTG